MRDKAFYEEKARTVAALAHPVRLAILDRLSEGPASTGSLVEELELPQPLVSQHLAVLRQAGVVARERTTAPCFPFAPLRARFRPASLRRRRDDREIDDLRRTERTELLALLRADAAFKTASPYLDSGPSPGNIRGRLTLRPF